MTPYCTRLDDLLIRKKLCVHSRSRRFIHSHTIMLNNAPAINGGTIVNCQKDILTIDGKNIYLERDLYLMMNKEQNTVCTTLKGQHKRVFDCITEDKYHKTVYGSPLQSAGRLDLDTEGLLLLTTDGHLIHKLTSPQKETAKTYLVYLLHNPSAKEKKDIQEVFAKGIYLPQEKNAPSFVTKPSQITWIENDHSFPYCTLKGSDFNTCTLTLTEGKFHQVKRMFRAVNNEVIFLKRIAIGSLYLDKTLLPCQYRELTIEELSRLL